MAQPTDEPGTVGGTSACEDQQADPKLPVRSATVPQPVRRIRCLDDPEILERVLAGLLGLR